MINDRELLGEGTFGQVYKETTPTRILAIKIPSSHENAIKVLKREKAIHSKLNHPNLVAYINNYSPPNLSSTVFLVMEYLPNGDLFKRLEAGPLDLSLQYSLSLDIAQGMDYLHKQGIIHRDLKPENILLGFCNGQPLAKIADLGGAVTLNDQNELASKKGTDDFHAPELIQAFSSKEQYLRQYKIFPYSAQSDVYAFAIVMWMMIQRRNMFSSSARTYKQVLLGARGDFPKTTPRKQYHLITACWAQDPQHRPNLTSVIRELETLKTSPSSTPIPSDEIENPYPEVFQRIAELHQYGEHLRANNRFIAGNHVINLAQDLTTVMNSYINKTFTREEANKKLSDLLTEGHASMGQDRRLRDYIAHFILACTGIGLVIMIAHKCLYGRFFLNTTHRQKKVENIMLSVEKTDFQSLSINTFN